MEHRQDRHESLARMRNPSRMDQSALMGSATEDATEVRVGRDVKGMTRRERHPALYVRDEQQISGCKQVRRSRRF
jgi:hypothetical protein